MLHHLVESLSLCLAALVVLINFANYAGYGNVNQKEFS